MIAVTFALPAESASFVRLLPGRLGEEISVLHTGVGEKTTRARMEDWLVKASPRLLISSGFCGALSDELQVKDLFLAENFSNPDLLGAALKTGKPRMGKLITSRAITDSPTARTELARASGAMAVDMETEFIAAACARRDIPMVSLRVITDTPRAPLPAPAGVLFDLQRQRTKPASLVLYLAAHPARIPRLAAFVRNVRVARQTLANALDNLISDLPLSG